MIVLPGVSESSYDFSQLPCRHTVHWLTSEVLRCSPDLRSRKDCSLGLKLNNNTVFF